MDIEHSLCNSSVARRIFQRLSNVPYELDVETDLFAGKSAFLIGSSVAPVASAEGVSEDSEGSDFSEYGLFG